MTGKNWLSRKKWFKDLEKILPEKHLPYGAWPLNRAQMTCEKHLQSILLRNLVKRGAKIKAYDPKAMDEAQSFYLKDTSNYKLF